MDIVSKAKTMRIGEVLIEAGYITDKQLEAALAIQKQRPSSRLGDVLVQEGFISEHNKLEALGRKLGLPLVNLDGCSIDLDAVSRIPQETARKFGLMALEIRSGELVVAMNDPLNLFAIEDVKHIVKMPVSLCLAEHSQIASASDYYYSEIKVRQEVSSANELSGPEQDFDIQDITAEDGGDAPVVRVLNSLLIRGFNSNASDIHIEPFEDRISVRIRVDGVIVDYTSLARNLHRPLIARIKILSSLDIAEHRSPQDGHFRIGIDSTNLNIRVSLIPTVFGEKAVLRFLNGNASIDRQGTFGMSPHNYQKMLKALSSPHGIVYITGPTGSGKTTTLYMVLEYLAARHVNIATIEDPVERNIQRVNQTQVNPLAGLTFESGLRSILRQDPDIIMVGETRDSETAQISIRAAITGHLVLSTLHTNDAASSIVRLADMGTPNYLISSSVVAVMAQRLVRKVCRDCSYTYEPDASELALIGKPVERLTKGRGCNACNNTGYKGRIAVHEIILIDKALRSMITNGASSDDILEYAAKHQGAKSLRESATELLAEGLTTIDELVKTAYYEGI